MSFWDDVVNVITAPITAPVHAIGAVISGGNVLDAAGQGLKSQVIAPFKPIQDAAPQGTFVNTAVGHISNSIGNAAINPITLAGDITSGQNVGSSVGNFLARDQAAIFAPSNAVFASAPVQNIVKKIPVAGGLIAQNDAYQYAAGEGSGHISDPQLFAAGRDQLEGAAVALGAIFGVDEAAGVFGVSDGTIITTGAGVGGALAKGNYAGAVGAGLGFAGDIAGNSDNPFVSAGGDLLGNVGDKLGETPTARPPTTRPPAIGSGSGSSSVVYPLPSATPGTTTDSGSSYVTPLVLAAGVVGLVFLARRHL